MKQNTVSTSLQSDLEVILKNLSENVIDNLQLPNLLQQATDVLVSTLNLHGCVLFLKEGSFVKTKTISHSKQSRTALKMLGLVSFINKLKVSLDENENLIVDTIKNNNENISDELWKFSIGVLEKNFVSAIQKATLTGNCYSTPLRYKSSTIGALLVTKRNNRDNFQYEAPLIRLFASQVAIAVKNASRFEKQKAVYNHFLKHHSVVKHDINNQLTVLMFSLSALFYGKNEISSDDLKEYEETTREALIKLKDITKKIKED